MRGVTSAKGWLARLGLAVVVMGGAANADTRVYSVSLSADGSLAAASICKGSDAAQLVIWDVKTGKVKSTTPLEDEQSKVAFSPTEKLLAVDEGKSVKLMDPETLKVLHEFEDGKAPVFSVDGKVLAVNGSSLHLWDVPGAKQISEKSGLRAKSFAVANDQTVYFADGSWQYWPPSERYSKNGPDDANAIGLSPDAKSLITWDNHRLALYDTAKAKLVKKGEEIEFNSDRGSPINWLIPTPDGKSVIMTFPAEIRWHSATDLSFQGAWSNTPRHVSAAAISGDGKTFITGADGPHETPAKFYVFAATPKEEKVIIKLAAPGAASTATPAGKKLSDKDVLAYKPWPRRELVKPMEPDWCEAYDIPDHDSTLEKVPRFGYDADWLKTILELGFENWVVMVAQSACENPADANVQKQVAYWRQLSINISGQTEQEDRANMRLLIDGKRAGGMQKELIKKGEALNAGTSEEQQEFNAALKANLFQKDVLVRRDIKQMTYWLDTPGKKTPELIRSIYVWNCLAPKRGNEDQSNDEGLARCGADGRRVDIAASDAEAKAMGLNELGLARAHSVAVAAKAIYQAVAADAEKRPKAKALYLDKAEQIFSRWEEAEYQPHKAIYDLALAAEEKVWAHRNEKLELGCSVPLRKELFAHATKMKPKTREDMFTKVAADPYASFLMEHLSMCELNDGDLLAAGSWNAYQRGAGGFHARGPRFAVVSAVYDAYREEQARKEPKMVGVPVGVDSPLFELVFRSLDQPYDVGNWEDKVTEQGQIVTMKKTKEGTAFTFKTEVYWEQQRSCTRTNQVDFVTPSGTVVYKVGKCTDFPPKKVLVTQKPVTIRDGYVEGLKPGLTLRLMVPRFMVNNILFAFPGEVTGPPIVKDKGTLVRFYGIPLAR